MTQYSYRRAKHITGSRVTYGGLYHVSDPTQIYYDNIGDFEAGQYDAMIERLAIGESVRVTDGPIVVTVTRTR